MLGLQVNLTKSTLDSSQHIHFIGAILDTMVCRAFLPSDRAHSLQDMAFHYQTASWVTARDIQRLLGLMAVMIAVLVFARLRMRILQAWLFDPLGHPQTVRLRLPR